jgi:hypothetical protein
MAATVQEVADGLAEALRVVYVRAHSDVPDNITPPTAILMLDGVPTYHGAEQGGLPTYTMRVQTVVDNLNNRAAFNTLNAYLSYDGDKSLRAALEADRTLGGVCQTLIVERAENIGELAVGDVRYLAADIIVTVYA